VILESRRTTVAGGAENRPPPCSMTLWLPATELRVTVVCSRVSRPSLNTPAPWTSAGAVGRSLVGHEDVGDIVHQGRHRHGVDRLQAEDDPGLKVVQQLGIGLVQMRGAHVVDAHDDHFP
jgi:hypothetical protein